MFKKKRMTSAKERSRKRELELVAKQAMGPIIPMRKKVGRLKPLEKSGVLHIGVVIGDIFEHQLNGTYRFEIRSNINAKGAWHPQYVSKEGPKKYLFLRAPHAPKGKGGSAICGADAILGCTESGAVVHAAARFAGSVSSFGRRAGKAACDT